MIKYTSLKCPNCGEQETILITEDEYSRLQNGELMQVTLERIPSETRERFISGFCPKCWKNIFSSDEEEDE